jgi:hypothetical protein
MRRLEEYLKKHSHIYTESASTNSKYFEIENCKIRMSDHLALESDADLHILIPINQSEKYVVFGNENTTCYLWGTNEIIEFIPYFIKMCNLKKRKLKTNTDFVIKKMISNLIKKGNPTYVNKIVSHANAQWEQNDIITLKGILEMDLNTKVPELPKVYVEFLKGNNITYPKALNLYKTLYIDNKFDNIDTTLIIKILNSL